MHTAVEGTNTSRIKHGRPHRAAPGLEPLVKIRLLALVCSLAIIACLGQAASADAKDLPIAWNQSQRLSRLGPLTIPQNSVISAQRLKRVFGKPSKTRRQNRGNSFCILSWKKLGLKVYVGNLGGARKNICKQKKAALQLAVVSGKAGKRWYTSDQRLRVGYSMWDLTWRYPNSTQVDTSFGPGWSLSGLYYNPIVAGDTADIAARVKGGTVVSIVAWVGGAGE